jgi:uncharacterized protein (TIGR03437 family)
VATTIPLPTTLAGTTAKVRDSAGAERAAPLFFVSPSQVNYQIPADTAVGAATVTVQSGDGTISQGAVQVYAVGAAIFTANQDGQGVPAGLLLRQKVDGTQSFEPLFRFNPLTGRQTTRPIDLGPEGERVFLVLSLSGIRRANDPNNDGNVNETVHLVFGGDEIVPLFAGRQPGFVGLDQIKSAEIPRSLIGRGRMNLAATANGFATSNPVEIEIAAAAGSSPPAVTGFSPSTVLAGQTMTITGARFASSAASNLVRIGGTEASVVSASATRLSVVVPFGTESGQVSVRTPQGEAASANALSVRASISGFVEDTNRQPIFGAGVKLSGSSIATTTNAEGAFILPNVPSGSALVEIDGAAAAPGSLFPKVTLKMDVTANRDNQFPNPISLQPVTGAEIVIGDSGSPGESVSVPALGAERDAGNGQTGDVILDIPNGTTVTFPDGATSGTLVLSVVENSRMPVGFPVGYFSSVVAQITPFGATLNPGGKLTFPNPDGFPAGSQAKLFRFDQTAGGEATGRFVEAGTATVSADGQSVETDAGAVTATGYYFVAIARPTTTVIGRVLDGDGATPVRRAIVRTRGRETFTDGHGSFILRNVPVRLGDSLTVEASYVRPNGRIDRAQRGAIPANVGGVTRVTPPLVLPGGSSNRPPVILAPPRIVIAAGQTRDVDFAAYDPDAGQAVQVSITNIPWVTLINRGAGKYALRLAPPLNITGDYPLTITATDSQNASASQNVSIKVLPVASPRIDALSTIKGLVGAGVTLTGASLKVDNNSPVVTFAGGNNARIPAIVTSASATEVRVIVPNNAVTGPIELTNAAGRAVTPSFIVEAPQDFQLTITPSATTAPQGGRATYVVYVTASKPDFTQLVSLSATGLQSGLTASFEPQQITAGANSRLTLMVPGNLTAGSYPFSVRGEADVEGAKLTRTAAATLNVTTAGQTMLAGRVLSTSKEPVIGATVSLDGKSATTDASGSFLLTGVTEGVNRPVMVDGRTASAPNRTYPVIAEPADIVAGRVNEVPYTFYLPPIDRQHEMDVIPNQETRVTTPMVPGLTMTIPVGANLRNRDGSPVSRVSLTSVEIDRTPAPLPAGLNMGMVYTSQPGGAIADIPMPVVYPNLSGADPGTRVELYYFNHDNVKWERYGFGRVSQDGRTISPEINSMTNRPYGLPNFSWHAPALPPPPDTPPDTHRDDCPPPPPGACPLCQRNRGPNPVDFSTGLKIETATDISFGGARGGLELTRTYTTGLAVNNISGRFGLGAKDNYSIRLTGSFQPNGAGRFVGEEGATGYLFSYLRTDPDGALIFTSTARASFLGDVIRKLSDGTFEYRHADGGLMRFDADGRLTAMVDRNGNTTTLTFSGNDLTLITDAVGRSIRLDYSNRRVISATDPLDRVWRYEYDGANRLIKVTDPLGGATKYEYGQFNRLASVTDKRNVVIKQVSYAGARVSQQVFADGGVERYDYGLSGDSLTAVTITDPLGRKTTKRFNAAGYVLGETDELGQSTTIERDIITNLPMKTSGPCNCPENTSEFDSRGNTVKATDRLGQTTGYEYEPVFNRITKMTDRLGRVTTYVYDARGNRVSTTDALGQTTTYGYDQFGQMTSITDPLGHAMQMEYDDKGNLTARIDALGNRTTMEYDLVGRLKAVIDPLGRRTSMEYDALDRLVTTTDASGAATRYFYDANGNQTGITDALGRRWTSAYDLKNRLITRTDPLGRVTRQEYDADDELITMTSPSGRTTSYTYDQRGQRTTIADALGGGVRFAYDNRRNMTALTDQRGATTTFTYDGLFRLTGRRDPVGQTTIVEYDAEGNVIRTVDRLGRPTLIEYDALNRRKQVIYVDATVTYTYDAANRLTRIDDTQSGAIEWSYDDANRKLSERTPAGLVSYAYNRASQRASMTAADRPAVNYDYDTAGRLKTITQAAEVFTYDYDKLSRLKSLQRPNGVKTGQQYDDVNRLAQLTHTNAAGVAIEDFRYTYNADDEIDSITSLASAQLLPAAKIASAADAANRIAQFGSSSFSFDSEGQTTRKTDGQDITNYQWDARGRLAQITLPNGQEISYGFDALGRRISRTADGVITRFLHDWDDVVLDRGSDGSATDYLNGLAIDHKLRQKSISTGSIYFLPDHLGSTAALTTDAGNLVELSQYEAFGETQGSALTRYGYTGRECEAATMLMYYRARFYSPTMGRFISEDPIGFVNGPNLYSYVRNKPIGLTDPTGLQPNPYSQFGQCLLDCTGSVPGAAGIALLCAPTALAPTAGAFCGGLAYGGALVCSYYCSSQTNFFPPGPPTPSPLQPAPSPLPPPTQNSCPYNVAPSGPTPVCVGGVCQLP